VLVSVTFSALSYAVANSSRIGAFVFHEYGAAGFQATTWPAFTAGSACQVGCSSASGTTPPRLSS
jgi:hypothetical protein